MKQLIKLVLSGVGSLCLLAGTAQATVPAEPKVNTHSLFYDFTLIADTGPQFTSLGNAPSINKLGMVAFQGHISTGDGVWAGNGKNTVDSTIGFHSTTRAFSRAVMISDTGYVIANDRVPGSPPSSYERIWPTGNGVGTMIAKGGANQTYASVLSHPALSADGQSWAYTALDQVTTAVWLAMPQGATKLLGNRGTGYRPMAANDGSVVLRDGDASKLQIQVYNGGNPNGPQVLASTLSGFADLGNQPGISDDGKVVAFLGNRGYGPGLFIAYRNGVSWSIVRVVGEGASAQGNRPELGFDTSDNPVYFSQLDFDSRVSVIHQEGGKAGMEGDTVVVSFIGTPSGVSTYPRFGHYPGLFFRKALGLWTMRVDFRLDATAKLQVFRRFALPVVQVGDTIETLGLSSFVVSALGVHDSLAEATSDDQGQALSHPAGSHRVAFWANDASGKQVILRGTHVNSCVLPVRHFSQCDARWGGSTYYTPPLQSFCSAACALTSVVMAANHSADFYGINAFITPPAAVSFITPLNGFKKGGVVNWSPAVQALRQPSGLLDQTPANSLHFKAAARSVTPTSSAQDVSAALDYLDKNLCDDANPAPVIVGVDREIVEQHLKPGHFLLVSGRANGRRFIADPGYANGILFSQGPNDNTISTRYDDNFETRGVIVDPVDLSSVAIVIDGPVEALITDQAGRQAGLIAGKAEPVNQIPNAAFFNEGVRDLQAQGPIKSLGLSFQMYQPQSNPLSLQVKGVGSGQFRVEITMNASDGTLLKPVEITDTIAPNQVKSYVITPSAGGAIVTSPGEKLGDVDGDGDVDQDDINLIMNALNQKATSPSDRRDVDKDGVITVLDARKAATLCTRLRCATQ